MTNTITMTSGTIRTTKDQYGNNWFLAKDVCEYAGLKPNEKYAYGHHLHNLPHNAVTTGKSLGIKLSGMPNHSRWINTKGANAILKRKPVPVVNLQAPSKVVSLFKDAKAEVFQRSIPQVSETATATVYDFCNVAGLKLTHEQAIALGRKASQISRANQRNSSKGYAIRNAVDTRTGKPFQFRQEMKAHNVRSLYEAVQELKLAA